MIDVIPAAPWMAHRLQLQDAQALSGQAMNPEALDVDGIPLLGPPGKDDFGMPLPYYLRGDLVDDEVTVAYHAGVMVGEEAIRTMVLCQYGIDINRDPSRQAPKPRRVMWNDEAPAPMPHNRKTPKRLRSKAKA